MCSVSRSAVSTSSVSCKHARATAAHTCCTCKELTKWCRYFADGHERQIAQAHLLRMLHTAAMSSSQADYARDSRATGVRSASECQEIHIDAQRSSGARSCCSGSCVAKHQARHGRSKRMRAPRTLAAAPQRAGPPHTPRVQHRVAPSLKLGPVGDQCYQEARQLVAMQPQNPPEVTCETRVNDQTQHAACQMPA